MDPLTHTLAGAALAETPLGRLGGLRRGLATATLLLAANLPDVDVSCYALGADFALGQRRGWTHGVVAAAVLPLLLAGLLVGILWGAALLRGRERRTPVRAVPLLALSVIGVWSHPLLDWLNVYGVRLLAPFDWTWYYGDAVYIVDPWLWLLFGGPVFLIRSRSVKALVLWGLLAAGTGALVLAAAPVAARWVWTGALAALVLLRLRARPGRPSPGRSGTRRSERFALAALCAALVYIGAMVASAAAGQALVRRALERRGEGPLRGVMVGPEATDPFRRQIVAETPEGYRVGRLRWLETPRLVFDERIIPYPVITPAVRAALDAPSVAGFVEWMRFPTTRVEADGSGFTVHLIDVRYARRAHRGTDGFGTATVRLGPDLEPIPR
ncbi:MAG: metal-dependent hydrolase [Acidobacteriota bacterium]|jgi:inner membrane protein